MKNPRLSTWLTRPDGLADRLRKARGHRTTDELAKLAGWAQSKVSRIENGRQMPTKEDVDAWAKHTKMSAEERKELHRLLTEVQSMRATFQRRAAAGQVTVQEGYYALTKAATTIRTFQPTTVPGMLQTAGYARAIIARTKHILGAANDIEAAVAERIRRGEFLYDSDRRFEFILGESALEFRLCEASVMRAQLVRLSQIADLANVRLGIIPEGVQLTTPLIHPFILFDDYGLAEMYVRDVEHVGEDAEFLGEIMGHLWGDAVEGDEAHRLITAAIDALPVG